MPHLALLVLLAASSPVEARPRAVDPTALAALARMGAFLRGQMTMAVKAETSTDEVLESGQKVQSSAAVELRVRRPDRLRADLLADDGSRQFFYDGHTFTLYGRRAGYYASFTAPPTIRELLEVAARRYGLEFPLADLFLWGTDQDDSKEIQSAIALGTSTVGGDECDHFAFRQKDVDWQIWIERGDRPVPRKLVVTSTDQKSQPQHEVVMRWDLAPQLEERMFTFIPPQDAHRIEFAGFHPGAGQ
jgi:hypothetical protein